MTSVTIDQSAPRDERHADRHGRGDDPDNDPLTYSYQWTKNGSDLAGRTSSTLNLGGAGNGDKGDTIAVRVTANDGAATSDPVTSADVTVQNSAPTVSVALDTRPRERTTRSRRPRHAADADGDSVSVTTSGRSTASRVETATSASGSDAFDLSLAGNGDLGDTVDRHRDPERRNGRRRVGHGERDGRRGPPRQGSSASTARTTT